MKQLQSSNGGQNDDDLKARFGYKVRICHKHNKTKFLAIVPPRFPHTVGEPNIPEDKFMKQNNRKVGVTLKRSFRNLYSSLQYWLLSHSYIW